MKALFIGGTGTISTAISKKLLEEGWDLTEMMFCRQVHTP